MPSYNRRKLLKATGAAALTGIAGCTEQGTGQDSLQIGVSANTSGGAWLTAFIEAGRSYCDDHEMNCNFMKNNQSSEQSVSDVKRMIDQDYDGIVIFPWAPDPLVDVVEKADDENIPVMTVGGTVPTPAVDMYTSFGNGNAATICAEKTIESLEAQKPDQDSYSILNIRGPFGNAAIEARNDGFVSVIKQEEGFNIADTLNGEFDRTKSQSLVKQWINSNGAPDAIYSGNLTTGLGAHTALDQMNMSYGRDHEDHIILTQIDGGPEANGLIGDGYIDAAVDQPNYFYLPIAMRYLQKWNEGDGAEEIPEPGTDVTTDDLTIESAQHKGVELWSEPIWAPASVESTDSGHSFFKTNGAVITEENADAPYHYGNIWG